MALSHDLGEVLLDNGHLGLEKSVSWATVQCEMGDGAHAGVTVGSAAGVRRWKLKYDSLFDDLPMITPQLANGAPQGEPAQSRTTYLHRFIARRFTNEYEQGLYFWVFDVMEYQYYAARFEDYSVAFSQVSTARQWSSGLSIVEVRMVGSPAAVGTPPRLVAP